MRNAYVTFHSSLRTNIPPVLTVMYWLQAAWFHDIGRPLERVGEIDNHDDWAANEATSLLADEAVTTDRITAIEHCLRAHSIRANSPEPETIEAKLLFDADKLDATGAVGLVRLACRPVSPVTSQLIPSDRSTKSNFRGPSAYIGIRH